MGTSQSTDQPSGQLITDEKTLERLFRASYPRWIDDAHKRLGPDGAQAAPRVVSKAFHLAWQDRKRFHSQEELDAFIGAQIHHGSTREISRKAGLHRLDNIGGAGKAKHETHEMNVDEAWDRLKHTLQGGAPEAYRQRASSARHEAAAHVAGLAQKKNWWPAIILGVVALAAALGGRLLVRSAGADRAVTNALAAPDVRNHETSYGQQVNVTLDDGTVARLGPESKLTVPNKFGIGLRSVRIEGTALFDVKTIGEQQFDVRAGKVAALATGTKFVVRKYRDEPNVIVSVKEGTVLVRAGDSTRTIQAGTSIMVDSLGVMTVPSTDQVNEAAAWSDGKVTIAGQNLQYVLPQLKRWYGLEVRVPDASLLQRKVFLSAAANSPREALTSIEKSGGLKFSYVGENMVFQDTVPSGRRGTKAR
jgi:ferric-dicitrate binding protein FerR (iron transport regulator)